MKISLITVSYNAEKTIEKTIQSVLAQDYADVEYILIDGASTDGTMEIVKRYADRISIVRSEKDAGMYDGINKGIALASGDVVGILNADDVFATKYILSEVAKTFLENKNAQALIGDIAFVNGNGKQLRYYSAQRWTPAKFVWGFMPPHPSFYCKRELFTKLGAYRIDFDIAADYELLIRFLKVNKVNYVYLPQLMVEMSMGGKSTKNFKSNLKINQEIKKACGLNDLYTNYAMLYSKYFRKLGEFLVRTEKK